MPTHSESLRPPELTPAQKIEAMARKSILDDYFKKLNAGMSSFLMNRNSQHQKKDSKGRDLPNIAAYLPRQFIDSIQKSLDRHLAVARDFTEFNELVKQEFSHVLALLSILEADKKAVVDEIGNTANDQYIYLPFENFSLETDLKLFLTSGPEQHLTGPLHIITLNKLFAEYQETKNGLTASPAATEVKDNRVAVEKLLQPA